MQDTPSFPKKLKMHENVELTIERLGIYGEGVGYVEGFTLFVDGALPGEKVSGRVKEVKPRYGIAKLKEILEVSPARVKPICPLFGRCGGCQVMHLNYAEQLVIKRQRVVDALERIAHFEGLEVGGCLPSPQQFAYRNKMQLPVKPGKDGSIRIGMHTQRTHDLVDVEHCYIHQDLGQRLYQDLLPLLKNSSLTAYDETTGEGLLRHVIIKSALDTGSTLVVLVTCGDDPLLESLAQDIMRRNGSVRGVIQNINTGRNNTVVSKKNKVLAGVDHIEEKLCGLRFSISATSFFQVNPLQAENLYNLAIEMASLQPEQTLLDAYCGVGTLSLIAAKKVRRVIGIEEVQEAVTDARRNAERNEIENVEFQCGTTENLLGSVPSFDVAFLNPPRKGCDALVLQELSRREVPKIVYISCDPATLARDLALLVQGGYAIQRIQPVDMFPQTAHVETVVLLERI